MFSDLPKNLQIRVIQYLVADNFPKAKSLHDQWMNNQQHSEHQETAQFDS